MQAILERWKALDREDVFLFWHNESGLKKELRQQINDYSHIKLENEAEFQFLRQALVYSGQKEVFHSLLFPNLNQPQLQAAMLNDPALCRDFLRYLPQAFRQHKSSPRQLQFLINLYREEFSAYYAEIVASLEPADCDYLLERTANKSLRQLLKTHQNKLSDISRDNHYGLPGSAQDYPSFPSLYGNKIEIIHQALAKLESPVDQPDNQDKTTRIKIWLDTADLLFMAGLLEDALTLLLKIYQKVRDDLEISPPDKSLAFKSINQVVPKTLSVYALMAAPFNASQNMRTTYQHTFPNLHPDRQALIYLDLYRTLIDNIEGNPQHTLLEMSQLYRDLEDKYLQAFLLQVVQNQLDIQERHLLSLIDHLPDQMTAAPHQAFIMMEIVRYLQHGQIIFLSREMSSRLLKYYIQLYRWIPNPLFMNTDIRQDFGILADEKTILEADELLNVQNRYSRSGLRDHFAVDSTFLAGSKNLSEKQLLLGSFLGV